MQGFGDGVFELSGGHCQKIDYTCAGDEKFISMEGRGLLPVYREPAAAVPVAAAAASSSSSSSSSSFSLLARFPPAADPAAAPVAAPVLASRVVYGALVSVFSAQHTPCSIPCKTATHAPALVPQFKLVSS